MSSNICRCVPVPESEGGGSLIADSCPLHGRQVPNTSSPGQRLYERWAGSEVSDHARYYHAMNPALKEDWERLGREWDALTDVLAQAAIVEVGPPQTGFLRFRVEAAHDLLAKGEIPREWRRAA